MNKAEFMLKLEDGLAGLSREDRKEQLNFYSEMIDDRMEEGLSEEDAVAAIGSVKEIVSQIVTERYYVSLSTPLKKERNHLPDWVIVLLIIGSPLWISLGAAALSLIITAYAVIWSIVGTLWGALFGTLCGCGLGGLLGGIPFAIFVDPVAGLCLVAGGLISSGLAIFAFIGCLWVTKSAALLSKLIFVGIKNCFIRKEKKSA